MRETTSCTRVMPKLEATFAQERPQHEPGQAFRAVVAAVVGTSIEWYCFLSYGVVATLVLDKLVFPPAMDPVLAERLIFAIYALGFATRAMGGLIFGHFGDKRGRKRMLVVTLIIMGVATMGLGLVPSYRTAGMASPALLFIFRAMQGFGIGGEWGGAVLIAYENAPASRRALWSSLPHLGLAIGLFVSSGSVALLSFLPGDTFIRHGWRVAFLASGVLLAVGLYVRMAIFETPEFQRTVARHETVRAPICEVLRREPRTLLLGMGALTIDGVIFNVVTVWSIPYLRARGFLYEQVLGALALAALLLIATLPTAGYLADRFGARRVFLAGCVLGPISVCVTYLMLSLATPDRPALLYPAIMLSLSLSYPMVFATIPGLMCQVFPVHTRYTGTSCIYQISRVYASGLTPMICNALSASLPNRAHQRSPVPVCAYVVAVGLLSGTCLLFMKTTPAAPTATLTSHSVEDVKGRDRRLGESSEEMKGDKAVP